MISQVQSCFARGKRVCFHGIGVRYRSEESSPDSHVRMVVFHHRGRFSAARDQPLAAGTARPIIAGAIRYRSGVSAVWIDVVEAGLSGARHAPLDAYCLVRLKPSARIRLCRFVRSIPKARAAPETFQLVSSSARRICSRSADARASLMFERGPESSAMRISTGTESGVSRLPGVRMAMRSMILRNSRALPGHE